eukprot:c36957_g1_i1 orf=195-410(+)
MGNLASHPFHGHGKNLRYTSIDEYIKIVPFPEKQTKNHFFDNLSHKSRSTQNNTYTCRLVVSVAMSITRAG